MASEIAKSAVELVGGVVDLVDAFGVKDLVQLGVSLTQQGVDAGSKAYAKKAEEKSALVEVAEIYSSDYRLKLEDAKRWLEEDGLKVEAVVAQPAIAYKDCSNLEVVASNFKLKQKVKPGTRIILKYVTTEVIKASRKLFAESERQKAEAEQKKADRQAERAEKTKQTLDKTAATVQRGFSGATAAAKKGIGGILSKIPKKEVSGCGCGFENAPGTRFCGGCGSRLGD